MNEQRVEYVNLDVNPATQSIAYMPGNGEVLWFLDSVGTPDFPPMSPIERAVFVTRLRALADMAEAAGADKATR